MILRNALYTLQERGVDMADAATYLNWSCE